ncbi:OmpW/AlkL family protein [Mesonia aestuariivivens]|uniref:Outer membrane beta-barrel protein n=1 Tax=Mesonia aestuariivivens TaxID=2796128 RepID=A0ABS6VX95_9FLAO|nr:OmpW family outer membrane protein [Mesonia aestuariivivens]MBW2960211.1 outer membrane beta-barrel protein [Mesonia aestuariivivens]
MRIFLFTVITALFFSFSAQAQEEQNTKDNPWQFRLRGVVVSPDEKASIDAIGGNADISTTLIPELDISYFFTENWALELILGTTKHDVKAVNTAVGDIDLGSAWLLPPTLTFQYHYTDLGNFKPYIGAGVNYTIFYSVDEGPVADDVDYDNSFAFAGQLGLDYMISEKWFINVDVKKLFLQTDATINATSALGATVGADVDINPWLFGVGFGVKL